MMSKVILLSIQPKFAERLFNGTKRVELRRAVPKIDEGDIVLIYVSSSVRELRGRFVVDSVIGKPVDELWTNVRHDAGLSKREFDQYFKGAERGYGIYIKALESIRTPISLDHLRKLWSNFHPPRNYKYLSASEFTLIASAL